MVEPTLLLTRPEEPSRRFAAAVAARFGAALPVLIAPLMAIRPLPLTVPVAGVDAVVLTSENAATALAAQVAARPQAWCVGERTASVARSLGFAVAGVAPDAPALVALLGGAAVGQRLLHARGRHVVADLPALLAPAGVEVLSAEVYDQPDLPLPPEAAALLRGSAPVIAALFSPRSAHILRRAADGLVLRRLHVVAISPAVARAAAAVEPLSVEIAARPDATAMLEALGRMTAALRSQGAGKA